MQQYPNLSAWQKFALAKYVKGFRADAPAALRADSEALIEEYGLDKIQPPKKTIPIIYGEQYDQAGQPSLNQLFSHPQLVRLTFMWVLAAAGAGMAVAAASVADIAAPIKRVMVVASVWLAVKAFTLLTTREQTSKPFMRVLHKITLYALVVMVSLSAGVIVAGSALSP